MDKFDNDIKTSIKDIGKTDKKSFRTNETL